MNNYQLYQLLNLIANKDVYSNWYKPEEFDLSLKSGNIRLMRDRFGLPERYQPGTFQAGGAASRVIETDLTPFLVIEEITADTQVLTLTNWYYINDFYTDTSLDPEIISQQELGSRKNHPIRIATDKYPWAIIIKEGLKIYPATVTKATVTYYRYPKEPVFTTKVNTTTGDLEYDETNSVELEWRDENKLDILHLILQGAGINIERPDLEAYAQKLVEGGK